MLYILYYIIILNSFIGYLRININPVFGCSLTDMWINFGN
jgi:hypothetical protein